MAAVLYRVASDTGDDVSSISWSVATPSQSPLLVVHVLVVETGASVTSVVYAGIALTSLHSTSVSGGGQASTWCLLAPPVGTATVRVNVNERATVLAIARSFSDADQDAPPPFESRTGTGGAATSRSILAEADDLVIDAFAVVNNDGDKSSADAGQTVDANIAVTTGTDEGTLASSRRPGLAGTVTMTWDPKDPQGWAHLVLAIRPGGVEQVSRVRWTVRAPTDSLSRLRWTTRALIEDTSRLRWRVTTPVLTLSRLRWTTRSNVQDTSRLRWLTDSKRIPNAILPAFSTVELLELVIPQRQEAVRFDVVDAFRRPLFPIHPDRASTITVANNANATIKRTLQGLRLIPEEAERINPVAHRLRAIWQLENGAEFSLGVFMFGDANRSRRTYGRTFSSTLFDQTFILDQGRRATFSLGAGVRVTDAMKQLVQEVNLPTDRIAELPTVLSNPLAWPAGTTRLRILNDLAAVASCYSCYFDNDGIPVIRPVPDLEVANAQLHYYLDHRSRVSIDSIVESDDLWQAANVYVVVSTSANEEEVAGSYEIPEANPLSVTSRGFEVVKVIDTPGIETSEEAEAQAKAAALQDPATYRHVEFEAAPDPRHDTFDVVSFDDEVYREQSWSLVCAPGGPHKHSLRRVDQVPTPA
jgi:hypothetical protein